MPFLEIKIQTLILLLAFVESGFVIGAIGTLLANKKNEGAGKEQRWLKFGVYLFIVHAILFCGFFKFRMDMILLCTILGICSWELSAIKSLEEKPLTMKKRILSLSFLVILAFFILPFYWHAGQLWFLYIYTIIAVLDAYSQIIGQLLGKTPLASAVSPNKTVEGAIGGAMICLCCALVIRSLVGVSPLQAAGLGLLCAIAGTLSDLGASFYKRCIGVKDYSSLIPGHGGFIDRFNGFIGVSALLGVLYNPFLFYLT